MAVQREATHETTTPFLDQFKKKGNQAYQDLSIGQRTSIDTSRRLGETLAEGRMGPLGTLISQRVAEIETTDVEGFKYLLLNILPELNAEQITDDQRRATLGEIQQILADKARTNKSLAPWINEISGEFDVAIAELKQGPISKRN